MENITFSEEFAFFDATHGRVKGHATFGLHVYHHLVRKVVRIASMESPSESTETTAVFFRMLNEGMTEVAGKAIHSNPHGIVYNEYGSNHIAMKKVYGNDFGKRVATCAFHFLQSLQRHAKKLSSDEREEFHKLGKRCFEALTTYDYDDNFNRLEEFIRKSTCVPSLRHWLLWWHGRILNWAVAFRPKLNNPNTNLSECYFSTYKYETNLALVDAAYNDVVDAAKTESLIQGMSTGTSGKGALGRSPSQRSHKYHEEEAQIERAKSYSTNIKEGKFPENRKEEFVSHSEQDSFRPDKYKKKCPRQKGRNSHFEIPLRKAKTTKMELSSENV